MCLRHLYLIEADMPNPYSILKCPNCGLEQPETKWVGWHPMEIEAKCPKCKTIHLHDVETGASSLIFIKSTITLKQTLDAIKFKHQIEEGEINHG